MSLLLIGDIFADIFLLVVIVFILGLALMLIIGFGYIAWEYLEGPLEKLGDFIHGIRSWWLGREPVQRRIAKRRIRAATLWGLSQLSQMEKQAEKRREMHGLAQFSDEAERIIRIRYQENQEERSQD
jgi:hypothetical protein